MNVTRYSDMTPMEQAMLLAFLPLLGATTQIGVAIAAAGIGVVTTMSVLFVSRIVTDRFGETARWTILVATGIGVSHVLAIGAVFLVPMPESALVYLYLIGVTPLVYIGARTSESPVMLTPILTRFVLLVVGFGLAREILGSGTLFGAGLGWMDGQAPVGLLASNAGALLLFATAAFISFAVRFKTAVSTVPNAGEDAG